MVEEANVLMKIITADEPINEETTFHFEELDGYKESHRFPLLLKELIQMAFSNENLSFKSVLLFSKKLNEKFHQLAINKEWIEVYLRTDALQNKFKLELPLRRLLTAEGLFLDSAIPENLFHSLLPGIVSSANDENILKICKVVNLAFKKTEFEQEILYYYLLQLLQAYTQSLENIDLPEQDLQIQKEKYRLIIHKVPTKSLFEKEELLRSLSDDTARKELVAVLIESFRNRYDMRSA